MTDRVKGFIVTLERELREDDAEATLNAIGQLRGVVSVKPLGSDIADATARARVRHELSQALIRVLEDGDGR